ncbi:MAG: SagB/ThcOx family dehydrogenase [Rickettsiales bacterium]|nr:MAG: SagB/ThcOx family dehydrogenase [Rickettsiales bacterium]
MKKFILLFILSLQLVFADVSLPKPNLKDPFLKILSNRKSSRDFDASKQISDKTLSDILYAANGVNRNDGKLVIPTAKDNRNLLVYVIKKDGAYLYENDKNNLKLITSENLYKFLNKQDFADNVSAHLLYVAKTNEDVSNMHAGSAYQNVANYCAENGIKNVVRAYIEKNDLAKALDLPKGYLVIISQAIGY